MLRPELDPFLEIAAHVDPALPALALVADLDDGEGHVLDRDAAALDRRHHPIDAVGLAAQDRGEQPDQLDPPDRRAAIGPRAIPEDGEAEIAAVAIGRAAAAGEAESACAECRPGSP